MIANIRSYETAPDELLALVDNGIGDFNNKAAPLHDVRPLSCFAEAADSRVAGGVVGRTWGECAEVQQLWVQDAARKQGLGTALMRRFEAEALSRGCKRIYLDTWSFQARDFYVALGYEIRLKIEGFGPGIIKYSLVRELG